MADGLLALEHVGKAFGGVVAVADVSFAVRTGQIRALIGPNGAGKTTLFNLITGVTSPDRGEIRFKGGRLNPLAAWERARQGIARTFQNLQIFGNMTVLENVMVGRHRLTRAGLVAAALSSPRALREEALIRERALHELERVGLAERRNDQAGSLPFGQQRLLEIARCLAAEPELLLLDEPAAGLHGGESERLGDLVLAIRQRGMTVLLVEHRMELVMRISDDVVVLNYGEVLAEGSPATVQADPAVIEAYLGVEEQGA